MGKGKTIACDFDGVIHGYSQGWQDGTIYDRPVPGAKMALEQLIADGYKVLIYTTRCNPEYWKPGDPDRAEDVKNYLDRYNIPYSEIHLGGKPKATMYIDDRAITFRGDWAQTLDDVENFSTWNRPDAKSSAELEAENEK